ncbi:hypothetical protein [Dysgonomonas termitidis]|uniref:Uncharacterized protein n=1 Tax=Dysgonomonas termitidis TaxID=1516126 RepID=A0ABV9KWZ3_9BACT
MSRAQSVSPSLQGKRSLFPHSYTRIPFGVPYGRLTCYWQEKYGLTMFPVSDK